MRIINKSIALTALLFTGFTAGSIAQVTDNIVNPEKEAPVVLATTPTGGEANIDVSSVIEITFNIEMDETTLNENTIMLHATSANPPNDEHDNNMYDQENEWSENENSDINQQGTINGTFSYSDRVAVFTPDEELEEGTLYTLTITNGVKSMEDVALVEEQSFSFTTTDDNGLTYSDQQNDRDGMDRNVYRENAEDNDKNLNLNQNQNQNGKKIELGKAAQFVILAKNDIKNQSESNITGQTGEGSVAEKAKNEKAYTDSARQRISNEVLVLESDRNDTSDTSENDVSEAIEDMMTAYNSIPSQNGETAQNGFDFDQNRDQDRNQERRQDRQQDRDQNGQQDEDDVTTHQNDHIPSEDLKPGVHQWSNDLNVHPDFTLSGSEEDVWIFKVGGDLKIDEDFVLTLSEGAQAENVIWYVEGEVTIGKNAQFEGVILSMSDITLEEGAEVNGRLFSQASITLNDNTVTEPMNTMAGRTTSTDTDK